MLAVFSVVFSLLAGLATIAQAKPTGGTETIITIGGVNYRVHTFTSGGTLVLDKTLSNVEYLIVGGGGGGDGSRRGITWGNAGGGGQVLTGTITSLTNSSYPITVGGGGTAGSSYEQAPSTALLFGTGAQSGNGGNSSFNGSTATGGKGSVQSGNPPTTVGTGGASGNSNAGSSGNSNLAAGAPGGAGGGAGGAANGQDGGNGVTSAIVAGTNVYYGAGGSTNSRVSSQPVVSGTTSSGQTAPLSAGAAGTGAGAGGGQAGLALTGGSGIVVVRYAGPLATGGGSTTASYQAAVTAFVPVLASGGSAPYSYAISPALPAGLSFDTTTGTVSGIPTAVSALTTYTVTVTDAAALTSSATFSLTVGQANQATLTASATPSSISYGGTSLVTTTGGSSSGALSYAVKSGNCTVVAATGAVTSTGTGNCVITATKAATTNYKSASSDVTITMGQANQSAFSASASPTSITYGGVSTVSTSGGSGTGALSYAVKSGLCSVVPETGAVTSTGVGSCVITATRAADTNYLAANNDVTISMVQAGQATLKASAAPSSISYGGTSLVTTTGGSSSGGLSYAVKSGSCTVDALTGDVTSTGVGNCVITATKAATTNYKSASSDVTITMGQASQTISFSAGANAQLLVGAQIQLTASASSNLPVSFALDSNSAQVCSIDASNVLSAIGAGQCTVMATQSGDANTAAAAPVTATFTVTAPVPPQPQSQPQNSQVAGTTCNYSDGDSRLSGAEVSATCGTNVLVSKTNPGFNMDLSSEGISVNYFDNVTAQNGMPAAVTAIGDCAANGNIVSPVAGDAGSCRINFSYNNSAGDPISSDFQVGVILDSGSNPVFDLANFHSFVVTGGGFSGQAPQIPLVAQVDQAHAATTLNIYQPFDTFVPVRASGGKPGSYEFKLYDGQGEQQTNLPQGLNFDSATGAISGVPTERLADTTYSVIVTDAEQTTHPVQFKLAVKGVEQTITLFPEGAPKVAFVGDQFPIPNNGGDSGNRVEISTLSDTICSFPGGKLLLNGVGTCSVLANQAGNSTYEAASQARVDFEVYDIPSVSAGDSFSVASGAKVDLAAVVKDIPQGAEVSYQWVQEDSHYVILNSDSSDIAQLHPSFLAPKLKAVDQPIELKFHVTASFNSFGGGLVKSNSPTITITVQPPPATTVTSLEPTYGPVIGNTTVVIHGEHFNGANAVRFDGVAAASFTVDSDTQISAVTPNHKAGPAQLVVETPDGTSTGDVAFSYQLLEQHITLNPIIYKALAGSSYSFTAAIDSQLSLSTFAVQGPCHVLDDPLAVKFDGVGDCLVTASQDGNETYSAASAQFTVHVFPPSIAADAGTDQTVEQGTPVTLDGSGSMAPAGDTLSYSWTQNQTDAVQVSLAGSATAKPTFTAPSIAEGGEDVTLNFTLTVSDDFQSQKAATVTVTVHYVPPLPKPEINVVDALSGPLNGGTYAHITGSGFTSAGRIHVFFGGIEGTVYQGVATDTEFTAVSPPGPDGGGPVAITVSNDNGPSQPYYQQFYYLMPQVVTYQSSAPTDAKVGGFATISAQSSIAGSPVTLDVVPDSASICALDKNTSPAKLTYLAEGTCTVDAHAAEHDWYLLSEVVPLTFAIGPADPLERSISGFTPTTGPVTGGTQVTISGTNLQDATGVTIAGVPAKSFTIENGQIIAITDQHLQSMVDGPVEVSFDGNVTIDSTALANGGLFTYDGPDPVISTISPPSVDAKGGIEVIISGDNLAEAESVYYGSIEVKKSSFTLVNDNTIKFLAPSFNDGLPRDIDITVVTATSSKPSNAKSLAITAEPVIQSVEGDNHSPAKGVLAGGTTITINGQYFNDASAVYFGKVAATSFEVVSDTVMTAVSPQSDAAGAVAVSVVTPGGSASADGAFTYSEALSNDATLKSLSDDIGAEISPAFDPGHLSYEQSVADQVAAISVTAQANHAKAKVAITQGGTLVQGPVQLVYGANAISILVTAEDGTTQQTYTLTVTRKLQPPPLPQAQTIRFSSFIEEATLGVGVYPATAQATSGLPVILSIDDSSAGVCTLDGDGSSVRFAGAGTCTINANQAGGPNGNVLYLPAPQVQQIFTVKPAPAAPVVTLDPVPAIVTEGETVTATANATGYDTVKWQINNGQDSVWTDEDGATSTSFSKPNIRLAFNGFKLRAAFTNNVGTSYTKEALVTVNALVSNQPSISGIYPAEPVTLGGQQVVISGSHLDQLQSVTIGGKAALVDSANSDASTITVTTPKHPFGAAAVVVTTDNGTAEGSVTYVKTVQSVAFNSDAPAHAVVGGATYQVSASAAGGAVTFGSGSLDVCAVNDGAVSFIAPGTCVITADQAGDDYYNAAAQNSQSFTVYAAPSTEATLSGLTGSEGAFDQVFDANTLGYSQTVGSSVASMTVTPIASNSKATITVNGAAVESGSASQPIALGSKGLTLITVIVTAEDEATTKTYTLRVTRAAPNEPPVAMASGPKDPVQPGSTVTLDGSGSYDPENSTLTYHWTQIDGPAVTLSSTSAQKPIFTAPSTDGPVSLLFSLTVNDGTQDSTKAALVGVPVLPPLGPPAPSITSLSRNTGTAKGSDTVVITGSHFTGVTVVYFGTQSVTISEEASTDTSLTVLSPPGTSGTSVDVTVTNGLQTSATSDATKFTYYPALIGTGGTAKYVFTVGTEVTPFASVSVTGGTGQLTYALLKSDGATPTTLPQGLSFSATTGEISGTPEVDKGLTTYFVKVSDQAPTPNYLKSRFLLTINAAPAAQTISFDPATPSSATVGDSTAISATASSQLPVTLSIDGASGGGVCSLDNDGVTVNFAAAGACIIDANQAGDSSHAAAPQVQATITVKAKVVKPVLTADAIDQTVHEGETATFSATATGWTSVRWELCAQSTCSDIQNATSTSYTTPATTKADNGKTFQAVFTNAAGDTVTSLATLFVNAATNPLSSDATLQSLVISAGTLSPSFSADVVAYTVTVPSDVDAINLTPTANGPIQKIAIGGFDDGLSSGETSWLIALNEGDNTITLTVYAEDGSTKTYTITVTREAAPITTTINGTLAVSTPIPSVGQQIDITFLLNLGSGSLQPYHKFATIAPLVDLMQLANNPQNSTVNFYDNGNPIGGCQNLPVVNGKAVCTITATAGNHTYTATYDGKTVVTGNDTSTVVANVVDQAVTDSTAAGSFLSDRANQIVTNLPGMDRQIDRLNQAQQAQGGQGASNFAADGKGDLMVADKGDLVIPEKGDLALNTSRLGAGPSSASITASKLGLSKQAMGPSSVGEQDMLGFQSFLYNYLRSAGESGDFGQFRFSGPMDVEANFGNGHTQGSFKASLSQMMAWQDQLDAKEMASLGFGHGSIPHHFMPFDIWTEGVYSNYSGKRAGDFGMATLGADYVFNPSLLAGFYGQFDATNQTSATPVDSKGWMIGSYATARLGQDVFWQGRAGWGQSSNAITPTPLGADNFASTRWLVSSTLSGKWKFGDGWSFAPTTSFTYFEDKSDGYVDHFGVAIPGATTRLGQLKLSPELRYSFATDSGLWVEPSLATELIWNFASTNVDGLGSLDGDHTGPAGLRGRVKAGINLLTSSGVSIGASGSYDGIGSDGYSAISGQASVMVPLN